MTEQNPSKVSSDRATLRADARSRRTSPPSVVLADSHRLFAVGLQALLSDDYRVVAVVDSGASLLDVVRSEEPDVVVADICIPGLNGVESVRVLREERSDLPVVLLSLFDDPPLAAAALRAGAAGYLLKHGGAADVLEAVRRALDGGTFVSPVLRDEVDALLSRSRAPSGDLKPRQLQIVRLLGLGFAEHDVAAQLGVSRRTLDFHKFQLMDRLGLRTRDELLEFARSLERDPG